MKEPLIFGRKGKPLHFLHANGYPPESYRAFLSQFTAEHQVVASYLRPLWPEERFRPFLDWTLFRDDLLRFFDSLGGRPLLPRSTWMKERAVIGMGHSIGGTVTLMAALQRPELFRALVLIEPVIFPPRVSFWLEKLNWLGLLQRVHPLIRRTRRRRRVFASKQEMFANYRGKAVFSRLSDRVLRDYVDGLAAPTGDGRVELAYPPEWEAEIYNTGGVYDRQLWKRLPELDLPVLVIRGKETNTLSRRAVTLLKDSLSDVLIRELAEIGHLAPLERPEQVARAVQDFLDAV
jgi:pimeloyl-ACP methyl ester carboxylesterase